MEKILKNSVTTAETNCRRSEILHKLDKEHVVYLGRLAIRSEYLGINDPLTHLYQYLERNEEALAGIAEDIETDIAERLPKTPFVNHVAFEFTNNDFISAKDKVSMSLMTKNNLKILKEGSLNNSDLKAEYTRAEIEAQEVTKLIDWFASAPIGSNLIFESLPIGEQKFAISRIYKKESNKKLDGCFVSLYSSSVDQFNEFHKSLGINVPICKTETDILQNNYEFIPESQQLNRVGDFIDFYTNLYDNLLESQDGEQYSFGIKTDKDAEIKNGIQKVKNQPKLVSTYINTIKTLAASDGIATQELIKINSQLNTGHNLTKNQNISVRVARDILSNVILGIVSAIDKANDKLLCELERPYTSSEANFATISLYAEQAKTLNETYSSNGCPEYTRDVISNRSADSVNSESYVMERAFNVNNKLPNNFGKPKIGVCRISNCPSRGDIWWWPDKTLVGGCDICTCCHKLFSKGKLPELVYADKKHTKEYEVKKAANNRARAKQIHTSKI